jgi:hypothetical protein
VPGVFTGRDAEGNIGICFDKKDNSRTLYFAPGANGHYQLVHSGALPTGLLLQYGANHYYLSTDEPGRWPELLASITNSTNTLERIERPAGRRAK